MKNNLIAASSLLIGLITSSATFAAGQAGDSRIQANGSLTQSDYGDTIQITLQGQRYLSDILVAGATYTMSDSSGFSFHLIGANGKYLFPGVSQNEDIVPYAGGAGMLILGDIDTSIALTISGGADIYIDENFGYNLDASKGLTSDYEDLRLSFGMFYEF